MRNQYQDHGGHLDQALKTREVLRPSSNIKLASEGDRIWNTGRNDYAPFGPSSEKPIKAKGQNTNLKPYTGKLDSLTEHRARFIPKISESIYLVHTYLQTFFFSFLRQVYKGYNHLHQESNKIEYHMFMLIFDFENIFHKILEDDDQSMVPP